MANYVKVYFNAVTDDCVYMQTTSVSVMSIDMYGRHVKMEFFNLNRFKEALSDGSLFKTIMDTHEDVSFNVDIICGFKHMDNIDCITNDYHKLNDDEITFICRELDITD